MELITVSLHLQTIRGQPPRESADGVDQVDEVDGSGRPGKWLGVEKCPSAYGIIYFTTGLSRYFRKERQTNQQILKKFGFRGVGKEAILKGANVAAEIAAGGAVVESHSSAMRSRAA